MFQKPMVEEGAPRSRRSSHSPSPKNIHRGVVRDYNPYHQSSKVMLEGMTNNPLPCQWLAPLGLGGITGSRGFSCPEPGVTVLVFWYPGMGTGIILGKVPEESVAGQQIPLMTTVGFESGKNFITSPQHVVEIEQHDANAPFCNMEDLHPGDAFSGDFVQTNEYGCMYAMLKMLALLKASDLAQIRLYAFDDLVQIISHNFQNFSSFGDFRITNDEGEISVTCEGAHREKEALGSTSADPFKDRDGKADQTQSAVGGATDKDADQTGLWRFKMYVGYLGDFFNAFITQPKDMLGKLSSTTPESGLFQFQVRTDGGCLIRSAKEVGFEKCSRIAVPKKIREADDPEGDSQEAGYKPELTPAREEFKWSDFDADGKPLSPFIKALQLRDYAAYLNTVYGPARLKKHKKDWNVPEEEKVPEPDGKYDPDSTAVYKNVYATIRILYDGSIVILDATGNTIHMAGKSMRISAPEDIWIEAGRNVNMLAGNDIIARARKGVDITATEKDVRVKAQNNVQIASIDGGTLIESQGSKIANSIIGSGGEDTLIKGVVIKAEKSTVSLRANIISLFAKDDLFIEALHAIRLVSNKILNFCSKWTAGVSISRLKVPSGVATGGITSSLTLESGRLDAVVDVLRVEGGITTRRGGTQLEGNVKEGAPWFVSKQLSLPTNDDAGVDLTETRSDKLLADEGTEQLEFTFRNDQDYRLPEKFEMYQTPAMQALDREEQGVAWVEKDLKNKFPYPGAGAMTGDKFVTYEEKNVNLKTAVAKDSATVAANKPIDGVKKKNINSSYIVRKL